MGVLQIIQDSIETHGVLGIPHLRNLHIVSFFDYVFICFLCFVLFGCDFWCLHALCFELALVVVVVVVGISQSLNLTKYNLKWFSEWMGMSWQRAMGKLQVEVRDAFQEATGAGPWTMEVSINGDTLMTRWFISWKIRPISRKFRATVPHGLETSK